MAWVTASYNVGFIIGPAMGGWLANPAEGTAGFRVLLFVAQAALSALCVAGLVVLVVKAATSIMNPPSRGNMPAPSTN